MSLSGGNWTKQFRISNPKTNIVKFQNKQI